jgi:hypothetical protein
MHNIYIYIHIYMCLLANNNDKDDGNRQVTTLGDVLHFLRSQIKQFEAAKLLREAKKSHTEPEWAMLDTNRSNTTGQPQMKSVLNYLTQSGADLPFGSLPKMQTLYTHLHPETLDLLIHIDLVDRKKFALFQAMFGIEAVPMEVDVPPIITLAQVFPLVINNDHSTLLQFSYLQRSAGVFWSAQQRVRQSKKRLAEGLHHPHDPPYFLDETIYILDKMFELRRCSDDIHKAIRSGTSDESKKLDLQPLIKVQCTYICLSSVLLLCA